MYSSYSPTNLPLNKEMGYNKGSILVTQSTLKSSCVLLRLDVLQYGGTPIHFLGHVTPHT